MKKVLFAIIVGSFVLVGGKSWAGCHDGVLLPLTANVSYNTNSSGITTATITGVEVGEFHHYSFNGDKVIPATVAGVYKFDVRLGRGHNFTFRSSECSNKPFALLTPEMTSESEATGRPIYFLKDGTGSIDCKRPDGSCALVPKN